MKSVDEMADELCEVLHGVAAPAYRAKYQRLAQHVFDLIAKTKPATSRGDGMTDEEVAQDLASAFLGRPFNVEVQIQGGHLRTAARARELFRPGSKAPEGTVGGDTPMVEVEAAKCRLLERRLRETQDAARSLACHARDLMAAARVQENIDEIEELIDEWVDDDLDDEDDEDDEER